MSELFYRLRSHTNTAYFVLARNERKAKVVTFIRGCLLKINAVTKEKAAKIDEENLETELTILNKTNTIIIEFDQIDFTASNLSIDFRLKLAEECIAIQNDVFMLIRDKIKGMDYATMSNKEFEEVLCQENTNYLFIALYLNECWAKLLEYQLNRI